MKVTAKGRAVGAAIASVGALVLSGCGGGGDSSSEGSSGDAITVWVDIERKPALEEPAEAFTKETGIQVDLVTKDFSTVDQDFISQVPTGKGPDVIVSPHDKLGAYVAAGVVAPIELGDVAAEFSPTAMQAMTYDGAVYGVPYSIENVGLVRNADLVSESPATFDDLVAAGRAAGTEYPFLVGLSPEQGDPYHLYPLQTSFGSQVFAQNPDGTYDPSRLVLGDESGIQFARALKKWGSEGVLNANIDSDRAREFFIDGKAPFYLTGPWNIPAIKEAGVNYVVDPIPSAGGQEPKPFVGVNGFFLSSKSANKLAATNFIVNFLSTEDAQSMGGGETSMSTWSASARVGDARSDTSGANLCRRQTRPVWPPQGVTGWGSESAAPTR